MRVWPAVAIFSACAVVIVGSWLTLQWAGQRLTDINSGEAFRPDSDGDELDAAEVDWLVGAPERTRVDPGELRSAYASLRAEVGDLIPSKFAGVVQPIDDFTGRSESVLVGVVFHGTAAAPEDRCTVIEVVAMRLAEAGWRYGVVFQNAIVTEYPIVEPRPQIIEIQAMSDRGEFELRAPPEGEWHLRLAVPEWVLTGGVDPWNGLDPSDGGAPACP